METAKGGTVFLRGENRCKPRAIKLGAGFEVVLKPQPVRVCPGITYDPYFFAEVEQLPLIGVTSNPEKSAKLYRELFLVLLIVFAHNVYYVKLPFHNFSVR